MTVQHHVRYSAWVQTGVINHCWLQIWILARIKCSELLDCRPVHPSCLLSIDCRFQYSTLVIFPGKKLSKKKNSAQQTPQRPTISVYGLRSLGTIVLQNRKLQSVKMQVSLFFFLGKVKWKSRIKKRRARETIVRYLRIASREWVPYNHEP